jgi:hypothetical protein
MSDKGIFAWRRWPPMALHLADRTVEPELPHEFLVKQTAIKKLKSREA